MNEPLNAPPATTPGASTPQPAPAVPQGTLWSKVDETLQRVAYKVARDDFGLSRGDFVIRYFPWRKHAYKINRLGSVVRVYFGVFPLDDEFEFYLNRALAAVLFAVQTRGSRIEKYGTLDATRKALKKLAPHWDALPRLAPRAELEVVETYKVTVKHKASGLIVVKEARSPRFSAMITDARIDMAEMLEAVEAIKREESK